MSNMKALGFAGLTLLFTLSLGSAEVAVGSANRFDSSTHRLETQQSPSDSQRLLNFGIVIIAAPDQPSRGSSATHAIEQSLVHAELEHIVPSTPPTRLSDLSATFGAITTNDFVGETPNDPFQGWIVAQHHTQAVIFGGPAGMTINSKSLPTDCTTYFLFDDSTSSWHSTSQSCS